MTNDKLLRLCAALHRPWTADLPRAISDEERTQAQRAVDVAMSGSGRPPDRGDDDVAHRR